MKTFEQWLTEYMAPGIDQASGAIQPRQPIQPQKPAQQQPQQQQSAQQPQQQPSIVPSEEQAFINATKTITNLNDLNEPFAQIVQTVKAYHERKTQQNAFMQKMIAGFEGWGEEHVFNKYLIALDRGVKTQRYPVKDADLTMWNPAWEGQFDDDEGVFNAAASALTNINQVTGFSQQAGKSVFDQGS